MMVVVVVNSILGAQWDMGWRSGDSGTPGRYPIVQRQDAGSAGESERDAQLGGGFRNRVRPLRGQGG